jgi:hypothetical protein
VKRTFLRTLAFSAATQFIVTRARAGRVQEEGQAEMLWMLYPLNVVFNALMWTLVLSAAGGVLRTVRRAL